MPYTMNGIGTQVCGKRGDVGWNSYDAMEWFVVGFMPIIPIQAIHTFDWNGLQYRQVRIKWSFDLVFRTFFTMWNWGVGFIGALCLIFGILDAFSKRPQNAAVLCGVGAFLMLLCAGIWALLVFTGQRTRDIRRALGPHALGSVDPALLSHDLASQFGGDLTDHAGRVADLLEAGCYSQAMWAARLAVVLEDRQTGEEMTDLILGDPGVHEALAEVRRNPKAWDQVMLTADERRQSAMDSIQRR